MLMDGNISVFKGVIEVIIVTTCQYGDQGSWGPREMEMS
jgi:hypothetical protein